MSDLASVTPLPQTRCFACRNLFSDVPGRKIQCTLCQLWAHVVCLQLDTRVLNAIETMAELGAGHYWQCDACTVTSKNLKSMLVETNKRVEVCEKGLERVEDRVELVSQDLMEVDSRLRRIENNSDKYDEIFQELDDRDLRKYNVVMHGVAEAMASVRDFQARKDHDWDLVVDILTEMGLPQPVISDLRFTNRMGEGSAGSGDPRPLLVGFNREETKLRLLDEARRLPRTSFSHVRIGPDLTIKQREAAATMRVEAETRNQNLTEDQRAKNLEWRVVTRRGLKVLALLKNRFDSLPQEEQNTRRRAEGGAIRPPIQLDRLQQQRPPSQYRGTGRRSAGTQRSSPPRLRSAGGQPGRGNSNEERQAVLRLVADGVAGGGGAGAAALGQERATRPAAPRRTAAASNNRPVDQVTGSKRKKRKTSDQAQEVLDATSSEDHSEAESVGGGGSSMSTRVNHRESLAIYKRPLILWDTNDDMPNNMEVASRSGNGHDLL